MKPGHARFDYFFNQLQPILTTASKQKNPALWLYRNNARTPLFMLEGLARLYAALHNKKRFTKIKEHFKLLEDTIGAIDYYDVAAKDLAGNKKIPAEVIAYLQAQSREKIQQLNEALLEKKWLLPTGNRVMKIKRKLSEADWMEESEEIKALNEFYGAEIYELVEFARETNFSFDNMENDVHELRRKLRWLSIYPQALRGSIQLQKKENAPRHLAKYSTPEIVASPFNKMPLPGAANWYLLLEEQYFYALSWMIARLGDLKDNGLHVVAVQEALEQSKGMEESAALKKAYQLLGTQQATLPTLLEESANTCKTYFGEQNLEHLVIGIKKGKSVKALTT